MDHVTGHHAENQSSRAGGMVFHVLNRGVGRQRLFDRPADDAAFEELLEETLAKQPMRSCGDCLMPNHWHFVVWPESDGDLAAFRENKGVRTL